MYGIDDSESTNNNLLNKKRQNPNQTNSISTNNTNIISKSNIIKDKRIGNSSNKNKREDDEDNLSETSVNSRNKLNEQSEDSKILEQYQIYPKTKLTQLGGLFNAKTIVEKRIDAVIKNKNLFNQLKSDYIKGFIVSGPPGSGKTTFVESIAAQYNLRIYKINGPQLITSYVGETETKLRKIFTALKQETGCCCLLIDDIETIVGKGESGSKDMSIKVCSQLKSCFESLNENSFYEGFSKFEKSNEVFINKENNKDADITGINTNTENTDNTDNALNYENKEISINKNGMEIEAEESNNTNINSKITAINETKSKNNEMPLAEEVNKIDNNIDNSNNINSINNNIIFVFATTSKSDSVDSSIKRSGIFDEEIELSFPSLNERKDIIKKLTLNKNIFLSDVEIDIIADKTNGYVSCDFVALLKHSAYIAIEDYNNTNQTNTNLDVNELLKSNSKENKNCADDGIQEKINEVSIITNNNDVAIINSNIILNNITNTSTKNIVSQPTLSITFQHLLLSTKQIRPNNLRDGFTSIPITTFNDIGGLESQKEDLHLKIVLPIKHPDYYRSYGLETASGILLYGPPGCGKTLLAKAVANAAQANFISVKGPELLNKYVGESEKSVRELFRKARNSQPCIIFFDEFDALAPKRSSDNNASSDRVVNQLLTEMDGFEDRKQVFLIAATNRRDLIDDAMLREGRLGSQYEVHLPLLQDRVKILQCLTRNMDFSYDLNKLALNTEHFSGADLAGLIREIKFSYIKTNAVKKMSNGVGYDMTMNGKVVYSDELFEDVLNNVKSKMHYD